MSDTISPEIGKRYLTRQRGVTGTIYCRNPKDEPDHLTDGKHSWHLDGTYCGLGEAAKMFDLISEFKDRP